MSETKKSNPATNEEKQVKPMPGEVDPKNVKVEVFLAMNKAKSWLGVRK